jgi:K+-sensing histidine kinase KdpD
MKPSVDLVLTMRDTNRDFVATLALARLGLVIVKHLAGLHGGSVTAASREGGGAVFTIILPVRGCLVIGRDSHIDARPRRVTV